jgi:poly-beta-hydroxyalkanoate depolymerase
LEKVVESVVVRSPFCRMFQVEMPRLRRPWLLPVVQLARPLTGLFKGFTKRDTGNPTVCQKFIERTSQCSLS